jgi:hypothetical protein
MKNWYCKNCGDGISPDWRIPLCISCRRAIRWAFIAGGLICGFAVKALEHWGWL